MWKQIYKIMFFLAFRKITGAYFHWHGM
jgi:hypothetical protein